MMRLALALVWTVLAGGVLLAQGDYFQAAAFNAPIIAGWEDQSSENVAQFHQATAQATIRTAIVRADDAVSGVEQDLRAWLDGDIDAPIYQNKVNLADGTWTVLVYQIDGGATASIIARPSESGIIVISFIETQPNARIIMATIAQGDESQGDGKAEMAAALEAFEIADADFGEAETITLSSGDWLRQSSATAAVMARVFGNDSYVALAAGDIEHLPELADAYYTSLSGFYITPDTSAFLWLGLAAAFGILGMLLFSFVWRERGLQKELALLRALVKDD